MPGGYLPSSYNLAPTWLRGLAHAAAEGAPRQEGSTLAISFLQPGSGPLLTLRSSCNSPHSLITTIKATCTACAAWGVQKAVQGSTHLYFTVLQV